MKKEQNHSKRVIRRWGGVTLLLLLILLIRLFIINTYYVGKHEELPNGIRQNSLLLVALQKEPKVVDDLLVARLFDDKGKMKLVPARLIQSSTVRPGEELLIDIGASEIWILREQVQGKVVKQIRLP